VHSGAGDASRLLWQQARDRKQDAVFKAAALPPFRFENGPKPAEVKRRQMPILKG
jgi:hypothetical protein